MDKDRKTREHLVECAKKEFFEKGYMKASLRSICAEAGVTTGALYFFFKDKDELFENVVGGALHALERDIDSHFRQELEGIDFTPEGLRDDYEAAKAILSTLFRYRDEFDLVLNHAQGSKYEHIVDRFVDHIYEHYLEVYRIMKGYGSGDQLTDEDRFVAHWMSHDQIDIFVHLLTHCRDEEEADKQLKNMFNYMVGGWIAAINGKLI